MNSESGKYCLGTWEVMWVCYEYGSLPAVAVHDGVNLNCQFVRIEISLGVSGRANYVVRAYTRPNRADCLIDFSLSDNRSPVACG